jgi:ATP-dependent helicase HrpA
VLSATLLDTERVWVVDQRDDRTGVGDRRAAAPARAPPTRSTLGAFAGRVVGSEQISLFGLVLAPKRPIHYGALFPEEAADLRAAMRW